jgi:RHS repeat-associated protein
MTQAIDPVGRETDYVYDATGLDLLQTKQKNGSGWDILETRTYNNQHQPLTVTDAAGQTTTYTYNTAGQVLTTTNAKSETTTYAYDASGYLQTVTGALPGSTKTYTYDGFGRIQTITDSESYVLAIAYDVAGRVTQFTYPDGTYDQTIYNKLDIEQHRDRIGRWTRLTYDANRRLVSTRDPLGRTVTQDWCVCGTRDALVDGNGNRTRWDRDLQARVTKETRADGSYTQYAYETTTSRLKQLTDAKGQVKTYTYGPDDALQQTVYTNAQVSTPSVALTYDTVYPRLTSMVDGTGTTSFTYHPIVIGQLGAGSVQSIDGPLGNDTLVYAYDEVGRVISRAVNGVALTQTYDGLGRVISEANSLGTFSYAYVGASNRLALITYPNAQSTVFAYFNHAGDDRLQGVHNKYPNGATLSKFDYSFDPAGRLMTWQQQRDSAAPIVYSFDYDSADELVSAIKQTTNPTPTVLRRYRYSYDAAGNRVAEQIDDAVTGTTFDALNRVVTQQPAGAILFSGTLSELASVTVANTFASVKADDSFSVSIPISAGTNIIPITAVDPSGNATSNQYRVDSSGTTKSFTHDANGNRTSDGVRTFEWDSENQLVAINAATHRTEFTYDGLRRRTRIVELENSVVVSDQRFIWDATELAERRDGTSGAVTARFYGDGNEENGLARYSARDHLHNVTEVTDQAGAVQARYEYDPYGRATKVSGSQPDLFEYTGVLAHTITQLSLMRYRVYDPDTARWLSEDPIGLPAGPNLYAYVRDNPLTWIDPAGTWPSGNLWSSRNDQDNRCTTDPVPSLGRFWDRSPCVLTCCQDHDRCYTAFDCNWSSWIVNLAVLPIGPCNFCNAAAALCATVALVRDARSCSTCSR